MVLAALFGRPDNSGLAVHLNWNDRSMADIENVTDSCVELLGVILDTIGAGITKKKHI